MVVKSPCPVCAKEFIPTRLPIHIAMKHPEAVNVGGHTAEMASLREENVRLKGELEAKLAEVPAQETDEDRFADLVEGIQSLNSAGKARLAEKTTGWTYNEPKMESAPVIAEPMPEASIVNPEPIRRYRIVVKPK